jgi:hypothetical protein
MVAVVCGSGSAVLAQAPLLMRVQNFTVTPSTGPVIHVLVRNCLGSPYAGTLKVQFPPGWKVTPAQHVLTLKAGELKAYPYTIEKGSDRQANAYPVKIKAEGSGGAVAVEQTVVCASAPYFKPTIDGDLKEWNDAIPITYLKNGRRTTVRTYWNNRQFSLAVEVEEDALRGLDQASSTGGRDAVQFALSPAGSAAAGRYEFLVAASSEGGRASAHCYRLLRPGDDPALSRQKRPLAGLRAEGTQALVRRSGKWTIYEVAVPFKLMPEIKPAPGREICFGLLVHDPDGTGLRDMSEVMNRWPEHRQAFGWCSWEHVRWGDKVPFDSKAEFGFCSSIH